MKSIFPKQIILTPIGIVHTPFLTPEQAPAQGEELSPPAVGAIEIFPQFAQGIAGIEKFEWLDVIYYFHLNRVERLIELPRKSNRERGIFATRSPNRPNHLGLTKVKLLKVEGNVLTVEGVDMIDGSPVLDIKPELNQK